MTGRDRPAAVAVEADRFAPAGPRIHRGWWLALSVCLLGGLIPLILCLVRLARHDDWVTPPRFIRWVDADGDTINEMSGASDPERSFANCGRGNLILDGRLWVGCSAGLARFDPETGETEMLWPAPPDLRVAGLRPGPDQRTAWVFERGDWDSPTIEVWAGIATLDGWERTPVKLDTIDRAGGMIAAAWVDRGRALEVALWGGPDGNAPERFDFTVARLNGDGSVTQRRRDRKTLCGDRRCALVGTWLPG